MTLDEQLEVLQRAQEHYEHDICKKEATMGNCYTPVEKKDDFASKGLAGTALGLSIYGAASALSGGGLGGLFGGGNCQQRSQFVTKEEFALGQQLAAKDSEIGLLKADKYTDTKLVEMYQNVQAQINGIQGQISALKDAQYAINLQQATLNATQSATISCIQQNLTNLKGQFDSLTHLSIPNSSICPGWGNVTITPSTASTTTAA